MNSGADTNIQARKSLFFFRVFVFVFFFSYFWYYLLLSITLSGTALNISHWFFLILSGTLGAAHCSFISLLGLFFFFSVCLFHSKLSLTWLPTLLSQHLTSPLQPKFCGFLSLSSFWSQWKMFFLLATSLTRDPLSVFCHPLGLQATLILTLLCLLPVLLSNPQQKKACWKEETRLAVSLHYHVASTISMSLKLPLPVSQNHWISYILKTSKRWLSSTGN